MSISFINHGGESVMFADYRECKRPEQQIELLDKVADMMKTKQNVRLLVDYNGIAAGPNYMSKLKDYGNTVFKKHMICSAVLGINGLKKILFNGYNRATGANNIKALDDREEALNWLVNFQPD